MTELIFTIIESFTIFFFGIFVSCAFSGIQYNKKNVWIMSLFSTLCSIAVLFAAFLPNPIIGWRIMPLLVHIPNLLLLIFYYHKRFSTSLAGICTAFLLCQPPRWMYTILLKVIKNIKVLQICIFLLLFILTFLLALYLSSRIEDAICHSISLIKISQNSSFVVSFVLDHFKTSSFACFISFKLSESN